MLSTSGVQRVRILTHASERLGTRAALELEPEGLQFGLDLRHRLLRVICKAVQLLVREAVALVVAQVLSENQDRLELGVLRVELAEVAMRNYEVDGLVPVYTPGLALFDLLVLTVLVVRDIGCACHLHLLFSLLA